jgi:hypothetical protein
VRLFVAVLALVLAAAGGAAENTRYSYTQTARCLEAQHRFGNIATRAAVDVIEVTYRRFRPRDVVDVAIYFDRRVERKRAASGARRVRVQNVTLVWRQPPERWARDTIVKCLS